MEILDTPLHIAKARCKDCWKQLALETDIITQAKIDMVIHLAEFHEARHPSHDVQVMIYEKAPETIEI